MLAPLELDDDYDGSGKLFYMKVPTELYCKITTKMIAGKRDTKNN